MYKDIKFDFLLEDNSLCIGRTIDLYIERTRVEIRQKNNQLLLSYISPHKSVKTCTVSRWLVQTLTSAGIDKSIFTGHSTRYASTSSTKAQKISIKNIISRTNWTSDSMFCKRYCKDILKSNFQKTVLLGRALNEEE